MQKNDETAILDSADRKLLRAVQKNCRLSAEELGEACGLSASAAYRRLNRLRELGVIVSEVAIIDPKSVGRPLAMIVGVRLERDDARVAGEFIKAMRANPMVTQCYFVTGSRDYVLILSASTMEEFDEFVQTELVGNPHVAVTETNVVIRPIKVGLSVPVEG